jgi:hypothetical protein
MKPFPSHLALAVMLSTASLAHAGLVRVAPAPAGEPLSTDYTVHVEGQAVPVYIAQVAPADPARRWKAMDDKANSADYFETASFKISSTTWDASGPCGFITATRRASATCASRTSASRNRPG